MEKEWIKTSSVQSYQHSALCFCWVDLLLETMSLKQFCPFCGWILVLWWTCSNLLLCKEDVNNNIDLSSKKRIRCSVTAERLSEFTLVLLGCAAPWDKFYCLSDNFVSCPAKMQFFIETKWAPESRPCCCPQEVTALCVTCSWPWLHLLILLLIQRKKKEEIASKKYLVRGQFPIIKAKRSKFQILRVRTPFKKDDDLIYWNPSGHSQFLSAVLPSALLLNLSSPV